MSTNNAVNVGLAGATGTGNFVGANTPTLITPDLGVATATSIVFNPTTSGIIGTTTNDNAAAGKVGEFISSIIASGSAVSISNGVAKDVTSISLTAGDWDVWGNVYAVASSAFSSLICWTSATSATQPDSSLLAIIVGNSVATNQGVSAPYSRYSLSGTTTIFLSQSSNFTGTATASGAIYARRAR